jgi:hypothetical protein
MGRPCWRASSTLRRVVSTSRHGSGPLRPCFPTAAGFFEIAESKPSECVALFCAQLLDLGDAEDNALAASKDRTSERKESAGV